MIALNFADSSLGVRDVSGPRGGDVRLPNEKFDSERGPVDVRSSIVMLAPWNSYPLALRIDLTSSEDADTMMMPSPSIFGCVLLAFYILPLHSRIGESLFWASVIRSEPSQTIA
jgi:hypothetical protein